MSVLITGAGLVGSHIARLEQEAGRTPVLFDFAPRPEALADFVDLDKCVLVRGDVANPLDLVAAVKANGVTRIINTAAFGGLTVGSKMAPYTSTQVNVMGAANVLEIARIMGLERVVQVSSSVLYVFSDGGQDKGQYGFEEAYPRPTTIYAANKQAVEGLASAYRHEYGMDVVCVRYTGVFGPWAFGGGGALTTMFEDWLRAAMAGKPVQIAVAGDWIYSKDAAKATHLACWAEGLQDHNFNVAMGRYNSASQIAAAINAAVGKDVATAAPSATASNGPIMNMDRSNTQLGFQPDFPIEAAMRDYLQWIRQHS